MLYPQQNDKRNLLDLSGFWEFKLAPWDLAAGLIMVAEAGGIATSFSGDNYDIYKGEASLLVLLLSFSDIL